MIEYNTYITYTDFSLLWKNIPKIQTIRKIYLVYPTAYNMYSSLVNNGESSSDMCILSTC